MEFDWRTGSHIPWSFESCDWFNVTPRDFINHHYLFIRWICQNVVSWHNGSAVYVSQVIIWFYDLMETFSVHTYKITLNMVTCALYNFGSEYICNSGQYCLRILRIDYKFHRFKQIIDPILSDQCTHVYLFTIVKL